MIQLFFMGIPKHCNHPQRPTTTHNESQPPTTTHSESQRPTTSHNDNDPKRHTMQKNLRQQSSTSNRNANHFNILLFFYCIHIVEMRDCLLNAVLLEITEITLRGEVMAFYITGLAAVQ